MIKCSLSVAQRSNIVAKGFVMYSIDENQKIHGNPLTVDYYRVFLDEVIKPSIFVPNRDNKCPLTVNNAICSFVTYEKNLVILILRYFICISYIFIYIH